MSWRLFLNFSCCMNFSMKGLLFFALLLGPLLMAASEEVKRNKDGKILSVFQVVSFPNDVCRGSTKNGTCYTSSECSSKGGTSDGSCANGYGVCCIFTINCGSTSNQNCTYFESSGVTSGTCRAKICPCSNNICQLRLDFSNFVITGPSTLTTTTVKVLNGAINAGGKEANTATQCLTDTFSVTSPSGSSNPVICGVNTGEHMYVDASDACNDLAFQLGSNAVGVTSSPTRSWNIKVTQLDCNSNSRAPAGCTQYFYGTTSGQVRSYNYNNGNGHQLANQNQKICIRRERGNCRICWSTAIKTDFAFSGMTAGQGSVKSCCGYGADGKKSMADCVQIPSASKAADMKALGVAGICGQIGLVSAKGATDSVTVCSMRTPFQLRFITDAFEIQEEVLKTNKGFELNYVMSC